MVWTCRTADSGGHGFLFRHKLDIVHVRFRRYPTYETITDRCTNWHHTPSFFENVINFNLEPNSRISPPNQGDKKKKRISTEFLTFSLQTFNPMKTNCLFISNKSGLGLDLGRRLTGVSGRMRANKAGTTWQSIRMSRYTGPSPVQPQWETVSGEQSFRGKSCSGQSVGLPAMFPRAQTACSLTCSNGDASRPMKAGTAPLSTT